MREAARLSGLRIDRIRFGLFVGSGVSAALASAILTAQTGASSPQIGSTLLLSVVTAVILGTLRIAPVLLDRSVRRLQA
jgi:ribose transport system permease protein